MIDYHEEKKMRKNTLNNTLIDEIIFNLLKIDECCKQINLKINEKDSAHNKNDLLIKGKALSEEVAIKLYEYWRSLYNDIEWNDKQKESRSRITQLTTELKRLVNKRNKETS